MPQSRTQQNSGKSQCNKYEIDVRKGKEGSKELEEKDDEEDPKE